MLSETCSEPSIHCGSSTPTSRAPKIDLLRLREVPRRERVRDAGVLSVDRRSTPASGLPEERARQTPHALLVALVTGSLWGTDPARPDRRFHRSARTGHRAWRARP